MTNDLGIERLHIRINEVQDKVSELGTEHAACKAGNSVRLDRIEQYISESAKMQVETQALLRTQAVQYGHLLEKVDSCSVDAQDALNLASGINGRLMPLEASESRKKQDWHGYLLAIVTALSTTAIFWMFSRIFG